MVSRSGTTEATTEASTGNFWLPASGAEECAVADGGAVAWTRGRATGVAPEKTTVAEAEAEEEAIDEALMVRCTPVTRDAAAPLAGERAAFGGRASAPAKVGGSG